MDAFDLMPSQAVAGGLAAALRPHALEFPADPPLTLARRRPVESGSRQTGAGRDRERPAVAVMGDPRLLCESIALILRAASIPAVVIERDDPDRSGIRPEGVILAVRGEDDLEAALEIVHRSWPGLTPVLVASSVPPPPRRRSPSAVGRLEMSDPVDQLVRTVDRALRGAPANDPARPAPRDNVEPTQLGFLTPRERAVLALLGAGNSVARIATRLAISDNTVRTHLANIRYKLGVRTTVEAVCVARRTAGPAELPLAR